MANSTGKKPRPPANNADDATDSDAEEVQALKWEEEESKRRAEWLAQEEAQALQWLEEESKRRAEWPAQEEEQALKREEEESERRARERQAEEEQHSDNVVLFPVKPETHCGDLNKLPPALHPLTEQKRWVVWKWERRLKKGGRLGKETGKWTKPPYCPSNPSRRAEVNNPATWGTYKQAVEAYNKGRADGIGYVLEGDEGAVDLDECRSGEPTAWAKDYIEQARALGAYVEATVSGTGFRIIGRGEGGELHHVFKDIGEGESGIEAYRRTRRYITISGLQIGECTEELPNIDELLESIVARYNKDKSSKKSKQQSKSEQQSEQPKSEEPPKSEGESEEADDAEDRLSPEDYLELLEHGTVRGVAPEHRGRMCHKLVWHLASYGKTLKEIIELLRRHPRGIAEKFLKPTDRLDKEVKASFTKFVNHVPPIIRGFNKNYAHVLAGSKSCILNEFETYDGYIDIKLLSSAHFHEWTGEHRVVVDDKEIPISKLWLKHEKRRKYRDIGFFPNSSVPGYYNLWRGFAVEPKKGDCSKILAHLKDNACQGDKKLYAWTIAWFADLFQHPEAKCGTALAFRGPPGVGKTIIAQYIERIIGRQHYKPISDPRWITGKFNSHMISLLLLFADEGFWAGSKEAEGRLKDLITGKRHPVEFKGKEAFWIENYVRLFVCGQEDWLVPASFQDRRWAILDVGTAHQKDHPYFAAIDAEMENGGAEALLYHLLHEVDCEKVNLREPPQTKALLEQKIESASSQEGWWIDVLDNGVLPGDRLGKGWTPSEVLFERYIEHAKARGGSHRSLQTQLGNFLRKVAPGVKRTRKTYEMWKGRRYVKKVGPVYEFPSLESCREHFHEQINQLVNWEEELLNWEPDGD